MKGDISSFGCNIVVMASLKKLISSIDWNIDNLSMEEGQLLPWSSLLLTVLCSHTGTNVDPKTIIVFKIRDQLLI